MGTQLGTAHERTAILRCLCLSNHPQASLFPARADFADADCFAWKPVARVQSRFSPTFAVERRFGVNSVGLPR